MTVAFAVFAFASFTALAILCWRLARAAEKSSILCTCIARIVESPERATEIAHETQVKLDEMGLWLDR